MFVVRVLRSHSLTHMRHRKPASLCSGKTSACVRNAMERKQHELADRKKRSRIDSNHRNNNNKRRTRMDDQKKKKKTNTCSDTNTVSKTAKREQRCGCIEWKNIQAATTLTSTNRETKWNMRKIYGCVCVRSEHTNTRERESKTDEHIER